MRAGSARFLAKLAVSGSLIFILGRRYAGAPEFRSALRSLDLGSFLAAEAILAIGLVLSALRWKVLLNAAGVRLDMPRSIRLYFIAYFFNLFLPTTVGGDVTRVVGVGPGVPLSVAASSVLVERFLGFGTLLALGISATFAVADLGVVRAPLVMAGAVYAVAVVVLAVVPAPRRVGDGRLARLLAGVHRTALQFRAYSGRPRALLAATGLSLGWQLALVLANGVLSQGLGGVAPFSSLLSLVPVIQAATMIPVSVGGLGVREMGYEFFFRAAGYDPSRSVALAAGFLAVTLALALKGGVVYLVSPVRGRDR